MTQASELRSRPVIYDVEGLMTLSGLIPRGPLRILRVLSAVLVILLVALRMSSDLAAHTALPVPLAIVRGHGSLFPLIVGSQLPGKLAHRKITLLSMGPGKAQLLPLRAYWEQPSNYERH